MSHEKSAETASNAPKLHAGGCHCGAVRYQATIDVSQGGRCNCSICNKVSQLAAIVKPEAFQLLSGRDSITEYAFGSVSRRSFCKHCGIHCFGAGHLAELGGDFVSVNLNTLDDVDPLDVKVIYWDGRHDNWQAGPSDQPWRM
ncbi:MAG TPA: GFA family protein [Polyangiaceae bacterium]|nr:GFA family protein [Polyangiaceae bacterium]